MKLFAVVLGGRALGCNIELHDVVFVIGNSIQECYPLLLGKWFGEPDRLHIDSYVELNQVDGYSISIADHPGEQQKTLYFINMGGYKPDYFGEIHEMGFFISETREEAIDMAKKTLLPAYVYQQHCDDKINVHEFLDDDIIELNKVGNYYIQIKKVRAEGTKLDIMSEYIKLDIPELQKAAALLNQD